MALNDKKPKADIENKRENPFRALVHLLKSTTGRLPAHLVIIFLIAGVLTVLFGVVMRFNEPLPRDAYLIQRIKAEKEAPVLSDAALRGVWAVQQEDRIYTLKIGSGIFEMMMRFNGLSTVRYFVRGGYRVEGNVLILQQREDLGSPYDPENMQIKHYPLVFKPVNLHAAIDGRYLSWRLPSSETKRLASGDRDVRELLSSNPRWIKISNNPR